MYHYISGNNKSAADSIKSFVLNKLKSDSKYNYTDRFDKLASQYGTDDVDAIEEEMVANAMFDILSDENVINSLAKENPSLLEKIITAIKDFVSELKNMAKNLPWKEVAVFQDDMQSLETIRAMAEAALWQINESGKNTSDVTNKTTKNTATDDGVKMSISSDFAKQLSSWDKKTIGFSFVLGYSSDALLKAGVPYKQIRWDATKIKNTLEKHSENGIDIKVLEKVPELLENPILIVDSKTVPGRLVVLGELYDNNGKIVVVALELNPKTKKGATLENIIKIATSQGRSHIQSLLDSEIRYIDENKERVQKWLNVNRLQLPLRSFNLNSITNISQNDTPVNTHSMQDDEKDTTKFSFAGENALTAEKSLLAEAMELEKNGVASEQIRQSTGWFRGYDNKWRFEIDDSKMKVSTSGLYSRNVDVRRFQELLQKIYFEDDATDEERNEFKQLNDSLEGVQMKPRLLGDLIDHDELFAAYPQLQDVFITFKDATGTADGWYDPLMNEIVINKSEILRPDILKDTLLHEIQHTIQYIEGFTTGSSPKLYEYDKSAKYATLSLRKLVEAEKKLKEQMSISGEDISAIVAQYNFETTYEGLTDSEYAQAYDRAAAQIKDEHLQDAFWDYSVARERAYKELATIEKDSPRDSYRKTAGEVEARDVSNRLTFDENNRKNTRPDIDRDDVVFADANVSFSLQDIERYAEKEYNDYGWVAVNEVLTGNELKSLNSQFADAKKLNFKYPKSPENEFMILVGDKPNSYEHLVYIKGDINHPIITQVVGVYSEVKKYQRSYLDEVIILNEQKVGNPLRIIEDYAGEEIFFRFTLQDYHSYNELQGERPGTGSNENSRGMQSGRRSFAENSEPKVKLSLKETAEASEDRANLIKANDNLRVANALLKKELKLTQGKMVSYDTAKNIAKYLTSEYSSHYDTTRLSREIYNIFNHYDKTGDYEYLMDYLATIGRRVVEQSSAVDNTLYEDYEDARKWVRHMRFTLPEKVLAQMNEEYDGKYARKTFGRMQYVSHEAHPDAPFLSQIYSELANEYPNFFSIEDNEYEQPMRLIEFWEKIQPTYYNSLNEMGYATEDDAAVGFAFDVFKAYSEADKHETFADKKQNEITKLQKEYNRNLDRVKKKMSAERDSRLEYQKEYYINAREKSYDGRKKAYVKTKPYNWRFMAVYKV